MKKLLLILVFIPIILFAQEPADSTRLWENGGVFTANFSQISLTN